MLQHELREPGEWSTCVRGLRRCEFRERVRELLLGLRKLGLAASVSERLVVEPLVVAPVAPELLGEGFHRKLEWWYGKYLIRKITKFSIGNTLYLFPLQMAQESLSSTSGSVRRRRRAGPDSACPLCLAL